MPNGTTIDPSLYGEETAFAELVDERFSIQLFGWMGEWDSGGGKGNDERTATRVRSVSTADLEGGPVSFELIMDGCESGTECKGQRAVARFRIEPVDAAG